MPSHPGQSRRAPKPKSQFEKIGDRLKREADARRGAGTGSGGGGGQSPPSTTLRPAGSIEQQRAEAKALNERRSAAKLVQPSSSGGAPTPVPTPSPTPGTPVPSLGDPIGVAAGGGGGVGGADGVDAQPIAPSLAGLQAAGGAEQGQALPLDLPSPGLLGASLGRRTPNAPSLRALSSIGGRVF